MLISEEKLLYKSLELLISELILFGEIKMK